MKEETIVEIMERLGSDAPPKHSGENLMFKCPTAEWTHEKGYDKKHMLGVRVMENGVVCNCFHPDCYSGSLLGLVPHVGLHNKAVTPEEMADLKALIILAMEEEKDYAPKFVKPDVPPLPEDLTDAVNTGSKYWESRGLREDSGRLWQVGELGGRALMPFIRRNGGIPAMQGRLLPSVKEDSYDFDHFSHEEKFRTFPAAFKFQDYLHGEHLVPQGEWSDFVLVVESPFDAMLLNQWLRDNPQVLPFDIATRNPVAVGLMGAKYTPAQAAAITHLVHAEGEIVVGMDTDSPGRLAQRRLTDDLVRMHRLVSVVHWKGMDPSDDGDGKYDHAKVESRALQALQSRENWFKERMGNLLKKRD